MRPERIERLRRELRDCLSAAQSIDFAWAAYDRLIIPIDAGALQRRETRRAFYAGVDWLLQRLVSGPEDEEGAAALLGAFAKELEEFKSNVQEGRA